YIRAIPSPICSTVPTSSSSASDLKLDNCSLKIADTSSGLTSIILFVLGASLLFCYLLYTLRSLKMTPQFVQLAADTGIDLLIAYVHDRSIDYRWSHLVLQHDVCSNLAGDHRP